MTTICLNMIVKNESHIIKTTLINLLKYIPITYYVISDTGSTDNTIEIIKDFFKENNINGEIYNDEWKDFGYNRSLALKYAFNKTDYLLIFDADDKFNGTFILPPKLNKDSYNLKFGGGCEYKRPLLINNRKEWKFVGVLHEYLSPIVDKSHFSSEDINGDYYIDSGKTGDRSKDPEKYKKDAIILENAHNKAVMENDNIKVRYSFYCAQSYRDSDQKEKSIEWYKKRVEYGDWNQEVYFSYLQIGNQYMNLKEYEKAIYYYSLAYDVDDRYECLYNIITFFRNNNKHQLAYQYYKMIKTFNINRIEKLFLLNSIYDYLLDIEIIHIANRVGNYKLGLQTFNKLFNNQHIKYNLSLNFEILNVFLLYLDHITENDKDLITNYCNFIKNINLITKGFDENQTNIINTTINKFAKLHNNKLALTISDKYSNIYKLLGNTTNNNTDSNIKPKINIFLSITSCKRYDLYQRTINSILYCFKDIEKIDYFLCVDDNSSMDDKKKMLKNYPFIKYYFKKENEKGHLASMNIIWNKLNELKPKYWIHLEDDWMFFKPDNYITKSIDFLEKYKNHKISQILFNKNYAEIITNYNYVGGSILDNDNNYILHIKDEPDIKGNNCAYWPHYSFRPSMILVDTILKLGDYTSKDTFFERSYADKYFEKGYKSAFFNEITSIHIGRLTSERFDKTKKNAYELNSISQFETDNKSNNNITTKNINFTYLSNKEDYIIINSHDHFGSDIGCFPTLTIDQLIEMTEKNNDAICFNTLGYIKNECNINTLIDFNDQSKGLIINIKRFNEKYGNYFKLNSKSDLESDTKSDLQSETKSKSDIKLD